MQFLSIISTVITLISTVISLSVKTEIIAGKLTLSFKGNWKWDIWLWAGSTWKTSLPDSYSYDKVAPQLTLSHSWTLSSTYKEKVKSRGVSILLVCVSDFQNGLIPPEMQRKCTTWRPAWILSIELDFYKTLKENQKLESTWNFDIWLQLQLLRIISILGDILNSRLIKSCLEFRTWQA